MIIKLNNEANTFSCKNWDVMLLTFIYLIRQMWIFFTQLKYRDPQIHVSEHFSEIA